MPGQKYSFLNKANPWEKRGQGEGSEAGVEVVGNGRRVFIFTPKRGKSYSLFSYISFAACPCHLLELVKSDAFPTSPGFQGLMFLLPSGGYRSPSASAGWG